jgi:YbbR domain-containing protein
MIKISSKRFRFEVKGDQAILIICMGIAFVFWLLVKLSQTYKSQKPVVFDLLIPEGKALTAFPPDDMSAEIEASGWELLFDYFTRRAAVLSYDLSSADQLNLSRGQLRSDIAQNLRANDIKVLELNYDNVLLLLEERASKRLPITVGQSLSFEADYHLKEPVRLMPDSVLASGPRSMVESLAEWPADSLKLQRLRSSQSINLRLRPPPKEISLSVKETTAQVEVEPFTEKSMYVPLLVKNAPDSLLIFPEKITVTVKLGLSKYDSVSFRDFTAEVDLKGATDSKTAPIILTRSPDFVRNLQFTPKSAKFFIVKPGE